MQVGSMLLWVIATTLVVRVLGQYKNTNQCSSPLIEYRRNDYGEESGLITVGNTGGGYYITVTIHTQGGSSFGGRNFQTQGGERIKFLGNSNNNLQFLVPLPSQYPRSTINKVEFNGYLFCHNGDRSDSNGLLISTYTMSSSSSGSGYSPGYAQPSSGFGNPHSYEPPQSGFGHIVQPVYPTPGLTRPPINVEEEICGVPMQATTRVVGGQDTIKGVWPWLAALINQEDKKFFCGSTLISKQHVISAAHCTYDKPLNQQLKNTQIIVGVAKFDMNDKYESDVQYRNVAKIISHEDYDRSTHQNDIAILLLSSPVKFTTFAIPICLWTGDPDPKYIIGVEATLVGWGRTEKKSGGRTSIPLSAKLPIVDTNTCLVSHRGIKNNINPELALCAGAMDGVGPCYGDSGSALSIQARFDQGVYRWYLRGIVSFSPSGNEAICDQDNYSVYTDAAKYMDWISKAMKMT